MTKPMFHVKHTMTAPGTRRPHSAAYWMERAIFQAEMLDLDPIQYERVQLYILAAEMILNARTLRVDQITL